MHMILNFKDTVKRSPHRKNDYIFSVTRMALYKAFRKRTLKSTFKLESIHVVFKLNYINKYQKYLKLVTSM